MLAAETVQEDGLINGDETHLTINRDNVKMLGVCGQDDFTYADVLSGDEDFTMMLRLRGGRDAKMEPLFLVFMSKEHKDPSSGVPDEVAGVAYRTGLKGWMGTQVLPQWLSEGRVMKLVPHGHHRVLYMENCSGHNEIEVFEYGSSCRTY